MNLDERLRQLPHKWYFILVVGGITMLVVNLGIFTVMAMSRVSDNPTALTSDPSPTPESTPDLALTPTVTPSPITTPVLNPTPTPIATVAVTPSPTPKPSPTPTPFEKEDIRIISPTHQANYSQTNIEAKFEVLANSAVESLEVLVNGSSKHTFTSLPFTKSLDLPAGKYQLQAKAKLKSGTTITSGTVSFGTGGIEWDSPEPTPTPTPTPTPDPTPDTQD